MPGTGVESGGLFMMYTLTLFQFSLDDRTDLGVSNAGKEFLHKSEAVNLFI